LAVIGLTKSLAIELGKDGVRVNAILPGVVEGERQTRVLQTKAQARGMSFEAVREEALSFVSMHTTVTPQQLADMILFLASPRGRTVSGQAISICGDAQMLA
jgi:NAD(P)-dependent dehydrogenase (short-subunit alcohol dehydrogenase family)